MQNKAPIKLDERIHLIDGYDLGVEGRTGIYVINEDELTLIETGPSPSVNYIIKGLEELGFTLDQVKYIIVTHIHLDHAGGAGVLAKQCPNAKVVVHPRGEGHLENPKKLVAGARAVYGDSFSELFDPIYPIDKDRLLVKDEGDTLEIGPVCTLKFYSTPGHAKHHFSIYDPVSNGMFTGDTVGIRYEQLVEDGIDLFLPSTSPNHFNPSDMHDSINRIADMNLDRIYFGHFGMTESPKGTLKQVSNWLDIFMEIAEEVAAEDESYDVLSERLFGRVRTYLRDQDVPDEHKAYILINLDMQVSSLGIIDYFKKIQH